MSKLKLNKTGKQIVQYLVNKGLNAAAAIGICGNIKAESNFNTAAVGDNGTSFGICQWHAGRGSAMKNKAGSNWDSNLTGQLDYLWHELKNSYKSSVLNPLKKVENSKSGCKKAADIFVRHFEIPANVDEQSKKRQANAADYWDTSNGGKDILIDAVEVFIKEARKHVGSGGHDWVKSLTTIGNQGWCAATMCAVAISTKFAGKIMPKHEYQAHAFGQSIVEKYGGQYIKGPKQGEKNPKVEIGDIAEFQHVNENRHGVTGKWASHHVAVVSKVKKGKITVIHGNWSNKYQECDVDLDEIGWFARPDWSRVGGTGGGSDTGGGTGSGGAIDLRAAIAQLYSSDNYDWVVTNSSNEKSPTQKLREALTKTFENIKAEAEKKKGEANIPQNLPNFYSGLTLDKVSVKKTTQKSRVFGELCSSEMLVQAPYIQVELNGIKIGGYNNSVDKYPNHVMSVTVEKISNQINNYTISLLYQIRAGEDPNLIDTILSRTGYRNKVKIKYGDSANGIFYKEEEAYIIDVTHKDNVSSASISYTIKAVSSVGFVKYTYASYSSTTSKPSTEIVKLLYNSGQISTQLQNAFGGMKSRQATLSKNLIPTNDAVVNIPGLADASPYDRLLQLTANMRNPTDPSSTYMLTFMDASNNSSSFKITEIIRRENNSASNVKNCYTLDVGFPGNTMITSFSLDNDVYWPLYYKYAGKVASYSYDIDYSGRIIRTKTNPLNIDDKFQSKNVELMNWWEYVRAYPVSATVTIKGLVKPIILMENVYIFSQIYGQQDLATGLYSIIGQTDTVNGSGCSTTLKLLKVD